MIERLSAWFPDAAVTGIDVTNRVGRLYRGAGINVSFYQTSIEDYRACHPEVFDLVLVCDVLHHVPRSAREDFIRVVGAAVRPGGFLVIKDWERSRNLAHLLALISDRVLTGDAVQCMSEWELISLCASALPELRQACLFRLPPHPNNLGLVLQRSSS